MNRRGLLLAGGCVLCLKIRTALAGFLNPGNPPEISAWMDRQYARGGTNEYGNTAPPIHCCGHQDGHVLGAHEDRWRKGTDEQARNGILYEVKIEDVWHPIREYQLVQRPLEDPNPVGEAVVFYGNGYGGVTIYCFSPWEYMG